MYCFYCTTSRKKEERGDTMCALFISRSYFRVIRRPSRVKSLKKRFVGIRFRLRPFPVTCRQGKRQESARELAFLLLSIVEAEAGVQVDYLPA